MTALMGLRTRLALARVALQVPGDRLDVETCASLAGAGVDLLVLGGTGDVDGDVAALASVRKRLVGRPVLIATSSKPVAAPAAADVVHLRRPGWRFWGYPRGHAWSLLGRHAADSAVVEFPGEDFDYLFVGPLTGVDDPLLTTAVNHQPPLKSGSVPWFALLDPTVEETVLADVGGFLSAGARRVALTGDFLGHGDASSVIRSIAEAVGETWAADERTHQYRTDAFHL